MMASEASIVRDTSNYSRDSKQDAQRTQDVAALSNIVGDIHIFDDTPLALSLCSSRLLQI